MHKKILALVVCFYIFAISVSAQEIKGLWAGWFEGDDVFAAVGVNFDESKIVLRFAGNELKGAIKNLKITADEISFEAETQPRAIFTGKIESGKISGTYDAFQRNGAKQGSGFWSLRKVDSFDFKTETKPNTANQKLELPKPTGKFIIGRKFFYWTDENRLETITDEPNDKRKVFVQLWYPAKKIGKTTAEYFPNLLEARGGDKDSEFLREIKTHAFQDAEPKKSKFPVIIFSPGLGSNTFSYTSIIENLVSHGYIVAAISHPYDTENFKFADGEIIRNAKEKWNKPVSKDWTQEQRKQFFDDRRFDWAKDISFVINQLEKLDKPFKEIFDWKNLGHFGHSFGGQASSIACASDSRLKACANLDGMAQGNAALPNEKGEMMKQPFMFFTKAEEASDAELKMMDLSRETYRMRESKRLTERWKPSFKKQMAEIESGSYLLTYQGVRHSSYSDWLLLNTNDSLFADKNLIAQNINDYTLAFFDKVLHGKKSTLLDNKTESSSPIILEFLKKNK